LSIEKGDDNPTEMRRLIILAIFISCSFAVLNANETPLRRRVQQIIDDSKREIARLSSAIGSVGGEGIESEEGLFFQWNTERKNLRQQLKYKPLKYFFLGINFFALPLLMPGYLDPNISFGVAAAWFVLLGPTALKNIRRLEFDLTKELYRSDMANYVKKMIAIQRLEIDTFRASLAGQSKGNEQGISKQLEAILEKLAETDSEFRDTWEKDPRTAEELPRDLNSLVLENA